MMSDYLSPYDYKQIKERVNTQTLSLEDAQTILKDVEKEVSFWNMMCFNVDEQKNKETQYVLKITTTLLENYIRELTK